MGEAKMKLIAIILISIFLIGCSSNNTFTYEKIDSKEALEIMNNVDNYEIIDVRTREEYAESHLDNAFNIPYDEINELIDINKDTVLFVYCKSGKRSKKAAEKLLDLGYEVYDLGSYKSIDLEA